MAKIFYFLATFLVHAWTFVTFHELGPLVAIAGDHDPNQGAAAQPNEIWLIGRLRIIG